MPWTTAHISIITYDRTVQQVLPLTDLEQLQLPDIDCPESGPTFLGAALQLLCDLYDQEVRTGSSEQKGDWTAFVVCANRRQTFRSSCLRSGRRGHKAAAFFQHRCLCRRSEGANGSFEETY